MVRNKKWRYLLVSAVLLFVPITVYADTSSSTNYRVEQTFFGSGGELNACSTAYCAKQTLGELGVGETNSASYRVFAGFNTTDEPYIEFVVTAVNIDLGYLDDTQAKTANGTFYVRAWQAGGYAVRTTADPPKNATDQITPLASPAASTVGTEQFGINLVANTNPATFGADPQQVPDNTFSFGTAATGYDTADQYKYNKGDVIAQSTASSSVTIYTLSYLFNISATTVAGGYAFNHVIVVTGTY